MPVNGRPSISQLRVSFVSPSLPSSTACVTPRPKLSQPASASSGAIATIAARPARALRIVMFLESSPAQNLVVSPTIGPL